MKQSLADSSYDAWIKFYRPNENSANATVSYYLKGSLVALALDLTIRNKTNHDNSLDSMMKALWQQFGTNELGVSEERIIREASGIAKTDMTSFFQTFAHSTTDLPLSELFDFVGIDVKWQQQLHLHNRTKPLAYLGCSFKRDDISTQVVQVDADSPAMHSGISAGDEILCINNLRVNGETYDSHLSRYVPGDAVNIHVFRRGWLRMFKVVLGEHPKTTCVLKRNDKASPCQLDALKSWLHI
jgi:predicted metalloprotease with PDZ domain